METKTCVEEFRKLYGQVNGNVKIVASENRYYSPHSAREANNAMPKYIIKRLMDTMFPGISEFEIYYDTTEPRRDNMKVIKFSKDTQSAILYRYGLTSSSSYRSFSYDSLDFDGFAKLYKERGTLEKTFKIDQTPKKIELKHEDVWEFLTTVSLFFTTQNADDGNERMYEVVRDLLNKTHPCFTVERYKDVSSNGQDGLFIYPKQNGYGSGIAKHFQTNNPDSTEFICLKNFKNLDIYHYGNEQKCEALLKEINNTLEIDTDIYSNKNIKRRLNVLNELLKEYEEIYNVNKVI